MLMDAGKRDAAARELGEAARQCEQLGIVGMQRAVLYNLCVLNAGLSRPEAVLASASAGWALRPPLPQCELRAMYHLAFVEAHTALGDLGAAWDHVRAAISDAVELDLPQAMSATLASGLEVLAVLDAPVDVRRVEREARALPEGEREAPRGGLVARALLRAARHDTHGLRRARISEADEVAPRGAAANARALAPREQARVGGRAARDGELRLGVREKPRPTVVEALGERREERLDEARGAENPAVQEHGAGSLRGGGRARVGRGDAREEGRDVPRDRGIALVGEAEPAEGRRSRPRSRAGRRGRKETAHHHVARELARQRGRAGAADELAAVAEERDVDALEIAREELLLRLAARGRELREPRGGEALAALHEALLERVREGEVHVVAAEQNVPAARDARQRGGGAVGVGDAHERQVGGAPADVAHEHERALAELRERGLGVVAPQEVVERGDGLLEQPHREARLLGRHPRQLAGVVVEGRGHGERQRDLGEGDPRVARIPGRLHVLEHPAARLHGGDLPRLGALLLEAERQDRGAPIDRGVAEPALRARDRPLRHLRAAALGEAPDDERRIARELPGQRRVEARRQQRERLARVPRDALRHRKDARERLVGQGEGEHCVRRAEVEADRGVARARRRAGSGARRAAHRAEPRRRRAVTTSPRR